MKKFINIILDSASKLSFSFLYGVSSLTYIFIYYIIGYRKKIVRKNLLIAFPERSVQERRKIEKNFYKNFSESMVELLKAFSMDEKEYKEHIRFVDIEVLEGCVKEERDVILLSGHMFNWEWLSGIVSDMPQVDKFAVYKKVENNFFDQKVHDSRAKFGCIPISVKEVARVMLKLKNDGSHIFLFIADQSPYKTKIYYELIFFDRLTPVFNGYDKIARKKNYAIVYIDMVKISQGKYEARLKRIFPDGEEFKEHEIVNKFYKELTQNIKTHPSIWLWSHKRWKYTNGKDYQL